MTNMIEFRCTCKAWFDDCFSNVTTIQFTRFKGENQLKSSLFLLPLFTQMYRPFGLIQDKVIQQNLLKQKTQEIDQDEKEWYLPS